MTLCLSPSKDRAPFQTLEQADSVVKELPAGRAEVLFFSGNVGAVGGRAFRIATYICFAVPSVPVFHGLRAAARIVFLGGRTMAKPKLYPRLLTPSILAVSIGFAFQSANAAEYTLMPSPQTVHFGYFSAALKPVLTINSGDIVTIETASQIDPAEVDRSGVVPPSAVPEYTRAIFREIKDRGPGVHTLSGPIFVNGAMPGDVLEVRIQRIDLAIDYGYNGQRPYAGALPDEFPGVFRRIIRINREAKTAEVAPGVVIPLDRPFFGTMGVAPPPAMGRISSGPPGVHTGNIDNKDVAAGTTLYMPIYAPGALFSVGDAHGAQGHGEVDLSAIETGLRGRFQFFVRKDMKLTWPRAETATHWIVMGLHPNLEEAMKMAVRETILFITQRFPKLSREEAYMIASVAVDYHVTQVVDVTKGIHAMIPKSIFTAQ
jgi:acetamidase/formamidase